MSSQSSYFTRSSHRLGMIFALVSSVVACDSGGGPALPLDDSTPIFYEFESRLGDGSSSVSYSGQIARHLLILQLKDAMEGLTEQVQTQGIYAEGEVVDLLSLFFDCPEDVCSGERFKLELGESSAEQMTLGDVSTGKNLVDKLAGNDPIGQHRDWSTELIGWGDDPAHVGKSPEELVREWFTKVEDQAIAISNGSPPIDPFGTPITVPSLSPEGFDYVQLTQKFLLGAVAFSQGADDYLDDSEEGKGLLSDHSKLVEGESYTELEHSWDEGFGYFGARADRLQTINAQGQAEFREANDSNEDGKINLLTEYMWGHATNALKRDVSAFLNLLDQASLAFYQGRQLIAQAQEPLSEAQFAQLKGYRDQAIKAWELAIATTTLHYVNEVLADLEALESGTGSFSDLAKHWSELKGFALSLQFNPRSTMSRDQQIELHRLIGSRPLLPNMEGGMMYQMNLNAARELIANTYQFEVEGTKGW